jgi:hypothetical protein
MGPPNLEDLQDPRVANVNRMGQNRGLHQGDQQGGGNGSMIRQGNQMQMQMDLNQQAVMDLRRTMAGSKIARLIDRKLAPRTPEKLPSSPELLSQLVNNAPEIESQQIINTQVSKLKTPAKDANLAYGSQPSAGGIGGSAEKRSRLPFTSADLEFGQILLKESPMKNSPKQARKESAGVPTKGGAALVSSTAKSVTTRTRLPKSK